MRIFHALKLERKNMAVAILELMVELVNSTPSWWNKAKTMMTIMIEFFDDMQMIEHEMQLPDKLE